MTTHQPPDDRLPGEQGVARRYRDAGQELPPPALDARILAEARQAASPSRRVCTAFGSRWAVPLSTAAVIVVAVGAVLMMTDEGALNHRDTATPLVAEAPVTSAESRPIGRTQDDVPAEAPAAPAANEKSEADAALEAKRAVTTSARPAAMRLKEAEPADEQVGRLTGKQRAPAGMPATGVVAMSDKADVITVTASGSAGAYQFNVGILSPDTGCAQFADWWEIVSEDGRLLYRRVLLHSHVDEQPFTRSGGPVPIRPDAIVWVRAHMNTSGYGGRAMKGSVQTGFAPAALPADFAAVLARQPPLPEGCDF